MALPSARALRSQAGGSALERVIPPLLGFLTAVGPVSTDIYLPAFSALESSLQAAAGSAQMTLAIWFVGLAIGQITMGPLSDRVGRRLPMLLGMLVYTVASVGCAMAQDIWSFSSFRLMASLGASASLVIPSACVRDIAHGNRAAKLMSQLVLVMGVVPVLAPTLGGMVLAFVSWRVIFWASAIYGLVCLALIWWVLPETLAPEHRQALSAVTLIMRYVRFAGDRSFIGDALIAGFSAFVTFTYLSAAPAVFLRDLGFSPAHFGMMFGGFAMCMIGASQLNGVLVGRIDALRMLNIAIVLAVTGAVLMVIVAAMAVFDAHSLGRVRVGVQVALIIAMMLTLATTGIIGPNATVGAMMNHPRLAGSASAFIGTLQYALGAVAGGVVGMLPANSPLPMAGVMLLGAMVMLLLSVMRPRVTRTMVSDMPAPTE